MGGREKGASVSHQTIGVNRNEQDGLWSPKPKTKTKEMEREKLKEWNLVLHGVHPTGPPQLPSAISAHQHLMSRLCPGDSRGGWQRGECTDTRTLCQGRHPEHPARPGLLLLTQIRGPKELLGSDSPLSLPRECRITLCLI